MSVYVDAQRIHIGAWLFFPEKMIAQNMHNGALAFFRRNLQGGWTLSCVNCPADWMLTEIAEWFGKWINGRM